MESVSKSKIRIRVMDNDATRKLYSMSCLELKRGIVSKQDVKEKRLKK